MPGAPKAKLQSSRGSASGSNKCSSGGGSFQDSFRDSSTHCGSTSMSSMSSSTSSGRNPFNHSQSMVDSTSSSFQQSSSIFLDENGSTPAGSSDVRLGKAPLKDSTLKQICEPAVIERRSAVERDTAVADRTCFCFPKAQSRQANNMNRPASDSPQSQYHSINGGIPDDSFQTCEEGGESPQLAHSSSQNTSSEIAASAAEAAQPGSHQSNTQPAAVASRQCFGKFEAGWSDAFQCNVCKSSLGWGNLNRRHHCRMCKASVCANCSPNLAKMQPGKPPERVCYRCMSTIENVPKMKEELQMFFNFMQLVDEGSAELDVSRTTSNQSTYTRTTGTFETGVSGSVVASQVGDLPSTFNSHLWIPATLAAFTQSFTPVASQVESQANSKESVVSSEPEDTNLCGVCKASFGAPSRIRKNKFCCRFCKKEVCATCSPSRCKFPNESEQHVCTPCAESLREVPVIRQQLRRLHAEKQEQERLEQQQRDKVCASNDQERAKGVMEKRRATA